MNNILVPTDFSETANNAVLYALKFANQIQAKQIVLLHTYTVQMPVVGDAMTPNFVLPEMDVLRESSIAQLQRCKNNFNSEALSLGIFIEINSQFAELVDGIEVYCEKNTVDCIIMGITGGNIVEEKLIGSNTIQVAKHLHIPVIIVPAKAKYNKIEEVLLATDLKHVLESTPITQIQTFLSNTQAKLFILHVHESESKATDEELEEAHKLQYLFENNTPVFTEVVSNSFTQAVNDYADKNEVDIIITIPKKRSFFESLFKPSHTNMLAFHSHVPLMVLHD